VLEFINHWKNASNCSQYVNVSVSKQNFDYLFFRLDYLRCDTSFNGIFFRLYLYNEFHSAVIVNYIVRIANFYANETS